jgi:hypothetical protein
MDGTLFLGNDGRLQWETLLTGVGAIVAARFTVVHLKQQIRQTEDLAERARQQRVKAARAMLPLALSQLTEYATSCIKGLCGLRQYFQDDGSLDQSRANLPAWALPPVPDDVLLLLKECVELMDDDPAATAVELISHLQIQRTRIVDYMSRFQLNDSINAITSGHICQGIGDAAEVYARASSLFPFSRPHIPNSFEVKRDLVRYAIASAHCITNDDELDALTDIWLQEYSLRKELKRQRHNQSD